MKKIREKFITIVIDTIYFYNLKNNLNIYYYYFTEI